MKRQFNNKIISCTWGSKGASLLHSGHISSAPAYQSAKIIDTLAAGDTYNAAIIDAFLNTNDLAYFNAQNIVDYACQVAGIKCTQKGLHFNHIESFNSASSNV